MKNFLVKNWPLIAIFVLAFFLRFWRIGNYPTMLWDETSLGYNAYSILKTGRDEYGSWLPLIFKSFGDYKPGFYVYLCLPWVAFLGLNEIAVRMPAVILGALTPLVFYFFLLEMKFSRRVGLASAFALAVMPWHIHFSRGAWESVVLLFWLVLGSLFFSRWLKRKEIRLGIDDFWPLPFILALFTYQGAKMMVPAVIFGLLFFNRRQCLENAKNIFTTKRLLILCAFLLISVSWYAFTFSGPIKNRLRVMSLFSYPRPQTEVEQILQEDNSSQKEIHYFLFHGQGIAFFRGFLTRYVNHLSPRFLAFEGDWTNPRHSAPYFGMVGRVNFILFLLGVVLFIKKQRTLSQLMLFYWLLLAPLPAALTRDIITGVRSLFLVIPLAFFIGLALDGLISFCFSPKTHFSLRVNLAFLLLIVFAGLFDFLNWEDLYFNHMVKKYPQEWLYGYKEAVSYLKDHENNYTNLFFTDFYGQPHIYYAFYSRYSPIDYQERVRLTENSYGDVGKVESLGRVRFRPTNWSADREKESVLLIMSRDEWLRAGLDKQNPPIAGFKTIAEINGYTNFFVYEKN